MSEKVIFREKLYLGESMNQTKLDKLKNIINEMPLFCSEYFLVLPANPNSQLEIFPARQLIQDYYSRNPIEVVGVAASYGEAVSLVEQIVTECLQERGDCALKEYLTC